MVSVKVHPAPSETAEEKEPQGCYRSATKAMNRRMRSIALHHAERYRNYWFKTYTAKFVKKIGKMAHKEGNHAVAHFVRENSEMLVDWPAEVLCSPDVTKNEAYLFCPSNSALLAETKGRMRDAFGQLKTEANISAVTEAIVDFAFGLRNQLIASSSVAKTKVREYWEDRIPPMVILLGVLLIVQLIFLDYDKPGGKGWVTTAVTLSGFTASFVMVYLRLPHAVDAATKQKASDYYIAHKDSVGRLIVDITVSPLAENYHHEDKVRSSFDVLSKLIDRRAGHVAIDADHVEVASTP